MAAEYRELATFDFAESPVNEQQIRTLHEGGFTEETRSVTAVPMSIFFTSDRNSILRSLSTR